MTKEKSIDIATQAGIVERGMEAYKAAKERGWVGLSDERLMIMPKQEPVNQFNPDWDAMAVMVEEQQRMAKRIEELEAELAKQEQDEPVGVVGMDVSRPHMRSLDGQYLGQKPDTKTVMLFKDLEVGTNLYTTPPKQEQGESVSWWNGNKLDKRTGGVTDNSFCIHTKPQTKEWVWLTDEDIFGIFGTYRGDPDYNHDQLLLDARRIEAKLKEKNHVVFGQ
jgi:hypothetical protein